METAPPPVATPEHPETPWVIQILLLRLVIWGSAAAAMIVFWFAAKGFDVPAERGFSASLLQGSPVVNLLVVTVIYLAVAGVASLLFGSFKPLIGVFAASFGLAAVSARAGTTTSMLRSTGSGVYTTFFIEIVLLAALAAIATLATSFLSRKPPIEQAKEEGTEAHTLNTKLLSIGIQTGVTIVVAAILAQGDNKGQALAAAGIAGFAGAMAADNAMPVGLTPLAILAPFVTGLIGYAWAIASPGGGLDPANSLANIVPLDYASFGVAGAMLGHWISQQWREEAEEE